MRPLFLLLGIGLLTAIAQSFSNQQPCSTSSASHETVASNTFIELACFDTGDAAMAELLRLRDDPAALSAMISTAWVAYVNANHYAFTTCGPCANPSSCQKSIGTHQGQAQFKVDIMKNPDGEFCIVAWTLADVLLTMHCDACEM